MSSSASPDARRRALLQQHVPLDLSTNWAQPQVVRCKSIRTLALSGEADHVSHGFEFKRPLGVIELLGSRMGHCNTVLLAAFSDHPSEDIPGFSIRFGDAVGTLLLPASAFAAYLSIVNGPAVYLRIGGTGEHNAIASDAAMLAL